MYRNRSSLLFLTAILIGLSSPTFGQVASEENFSFFRQASRSRSAQKSLVEKIRQRYLANEEDVAEFRGDHTIAADEVIDRSVLVVNGDLVVAGEVYGKVVVVNGDLIVRRSARITGDAISVNGAVHRVRGADIGGEIVEASLLPAKRKRSRRAARSRAATRTGPEHGYREWREKPKSSHYRFKRRFREPFIDDWQEDQESFLWRYNRVEGLFLGINVPPGYMYDRQPLRFDLHGFLGYGFRNKQWRYRVAGELLLFRRSRLLIGGTVYDLTDTPDRWRIPTSENSLAAGLIREDFHDYFRRSGYGVYAGHRLFHVFRVQAGFYDERFEWMPTVTNWSLFGGDKRFRPNPLIDEGHSRAVKAGLVFDTRDRRKAPRRGWLLQAQAELSRPVYGSDFDYDRIVFDLRRYIPVGVGENLDIRLRAGSSRGTLPLQYRFYLGGLSTLRAFGYKSLAGNRMVLANVEYRIASWSPRFRNHDILDSISLAVFLDAGRAWFTPETTDYFEGFDELKWRRLNADFGIAFTDDEGRVRLNLARRIDGGSRDIVVTFRLNRPF